MNQLPIEISVEETAQLLPKEGGVRLIDCREPDEFAICKIDGSQLLPLSNFASLAEKALGGGAPDQRIIVYCHHGARSLRATQYLRQKGFSQAQSMSGGIEEWSLQIDGSVKRY